MVSEYYERLEGDGCLIDSPSDPELNLWKDQIVSTRLLNVLANRLGESLDTITVAQAKTVTPTELAREYNCGKKTRLEFEAWLEGEDPSSWGTRRLKRTLDNEIEKLSIRLEQLRKRREAIS